MNGASVYAMCNAAIGSAEDSLCLSFIVGFVRGLAAGDAQSQEFDRHVCIPDGITGPQFEAIVRKSMAERPDLINAQHPETVIAAPIYAAFPCK